jgi:hypothetical protein
MGNTEYTTLHTTLHHTHTTPLHYTIHYTIHYTPTILHYNTPHTHYTPNLHLVWNGLDQTHNIHCAARANIFKQLRQELGPCLVCACVYVSV